MVSWSAFSIIKTNHFDFNQDGNSLQLLINNEWKIMLLIAT